MPIKTVQQLLAPFSETTPPVPDEPTKQDLEPWRERIDALDVAVLILLNERSNCANQIGLIKKRLGIPVYVPSRETEVLNNVLSTNRGPLPDTAVRRLFERIIDETRALERHLYQEDSGPITDDGTND